MSIDARLEHAAAKPVIVPDAIVIDHGKVFISDTFTAACRTLGNRGPARPPGHPDRQGRRRADVLLDQHPVLPARCRLRRP
ncbi:hypothetical protein [Streptomyces sp. NPDC004435]|uniref:hypothetical protein n=1 Tax=Streptomyces sp. NPDC004435 TaxID=3364701 RepID=UPI00367E843B